MSAEDKINFERTNSFHPPRRFGPAGASSGRNKLFCSKFILLYILGFSQLNTQIFFEKSYIYWT
jgi:hypothetical protein